jgi:formylglycine-generating enzyme required for sulfatase activity
VGEIGRLPVSRRNVIDPQTGNEESREVDWERQRVVRISRPFRMSETEVTQQQWTAVMGTTPWKGQMNVDEGDLYPACWISWGEQVEFTKRLSEREQRKYRLPTEAEWEYACRAGSLESYSFGDNSLLLNNFAWTNRNSNGRAQPVGRRQPNSLGLFDLHGNLLENCLDRFAEYPAGSVTDPRCDEGEGRVRRGGSFRNDDQNNSFRSAYRTSEADDFRDRSLGFRVVQELP